MTVLSSVVITGKSCVIRVIIVGDTWQTKQCQNVQAVDGSITMEELLEVLRVNGTNGQKE